MEIYLFNFGLIFLLNIFGVLYVKRIRLLLLFDLIFLVITCLFLIFINEEFRVQLLETYLLKQFVIFFWIISRNFSLKNVKCNIVSNFFAIMNLLILTLQFLYVFDNFVRDIVILIFLSLLFKYTTYSKINSIFLIGFISTIILISSNLIYSLYGLDDAILITFTSLWHVSLFLIIYYLSIYLLFYKISKLKLIQIAYDLKNVINFLLLYVFLVTFLQFIVHHNHYLALQTVIISVILAFLQIRGAIHVRQVLMEKYSPWL